MPYDDEDLSSSSTLLAGKHVFARDKRNIDIVAAAVFSFLEISRVIMLFSCVRAAFSPDDEAVQ
jgi:hypothetical protein